ncbi:MAG: 3'-5' exonuclease [Veillonellales bacterium]
MLNKSIPVAIRHELQQQNFTAIDFETANGQRNSACQLGIAVIDAGKTVMKKSWLIKPPTDYFTFSYLHGITHETVRHAPTFGELWPEFQPYIEHKIVAAHNACFDIGVLMAILKTYQLPVPKFYVIDSLQVARRTWPGLKNHKLSTVADYLKIGLQHHDAGSDAAVCAEIICRAGWNNATVRQGT